MGNTFFQFRHTFLLSANAPQSHAKSCLSLMSHHQVNNKCNNSNNNKRTALKVANLCPMYFFIFCYVFSEATTTVLESFTKSLFFLKMMKLYRHLFSMNKTYFCWNFHFLVDWRHKHLKNIVDLLLFYGEHYYGFLGSDLRKKSEKNIHFTIIISIYTGHRHFEVFLSFILYIL